MSGGEYVAAEHIAERPSWDCLCCTKPWPCDPAREALKLEYRGNMTGLRMYLWSNLEEAAEQLPPTPFREIILRFLGWA